MNKKILLKYLKNSCSDKEFEEFTAWVKEKGMNKEASNWGFEQWESLEPEVKEKDNEKYNALLHKIHHEINLSNSRNNQDKGIALSNITKWMIRVAAILFLPLLGVVVYLISSNVNLQTEQFTGLAVDSVEVIAPTGSRTIVQLSDGTEVNLNYGSRIKYPRNFTGDSREIKLTGEGYFDVAPNPDKPFVVKTRKLNIKALGTEFNVQAYADDPFISATLVEGKVVIEEKTTGMKAMPVGSMVPGQHIEYNAETGKISSSKGSVEKYIAWKNGYMVFDNEPITGVARELSRKFNVDIEIADDVKDLTYTVTFADDPLFLILDLMTETTPVTYKRFPREKLANGTYTKQKIRIEKRK